MELTGPYLAASMLLVVAGGAKLWHPAPGGSARLSFHGTPLVRPWVVRGFAAGEMTLGLCGLVVINEFVAGLVATCYGGFAVLVALVRRRADGLADCGCFGESAAPASRFHMAVDVGLSAAAVAVAFAAGPSPRLATSVLTAQPLHGVPIAMSSAMCAWLLFLVLSTMPRTLAAGRLATEHFRSTNGRGVEAA